MRRCVCWMGPVGSGKSVTCCFEIVGDGLRNREPDENGIRRSRCAIVRETVPVRLSDTTIKTFLDWFPPGPCGVFRKTTKTYFLVLVT